MLAGLSISLLAVCASVCICADEMVTRLQVVCVTSLTSDGSLETKAADDSLAVRKAASADVDAVCARLVNSHCQNAIVAVLILAFDKPVF